MIRLHYTPLLKEGGLKNGFSKKELEKNCKTHQKSIDMVFNGHHKTGYAFLDLPDDKALVKKIKTFVADQKKLKWENIVVLGIGGSALGLIALQEALLSPFNARPKLCVVDNIDPHYTHELFNHLDFKKTLFIVISKSGSTVEPMMLYGLAKERLQKQVKNWQKHMVFITDAKAGLLLPIAKKEKIVTFEVPDKVGGRFSVLTAVGLVPAALAGIDIENLLKGAKMMRDNLKKNKGIKNDALIASVAQYFFDTQKGKCMTVMMPYSSKLFRMGDWYRQLLAESLGKNENVGPTPLSALGTTDQHSQLQLYSEGPNNKLLIFLRLLKPNKDLKLGKNLPQAIDFLNHKKMSQVMDAAYRGTALALTKKERPHFTMEIDDLSAKNIGALFMFFEIQVALLGLLYNVNAFDQPGVEDSKILTKKILAQQ